MRTNAVALRTRTTIAVALAALVVSTSMALLTFQLTRTYLTGQRDRLATRQALLNARLVQDLLPASTADDQLGTPLAPLPLEGGSQALVRTGDRWVGSAVGFTDADVPPSVAAGMRDGAVSRQRVRIDGATHIVVGVPLLDGQAAYVEFFPLLELRRTLRTTAATLAASAAITTLAGAVFGASLSRRVLHPLEATSMVARRIADGDRELRLPTTGDRQLGPLYDSFNGMVDALEERAERERRFAADVSHELRTPLTALLSAVAILDRQRDELPERAQFAAEIMTSQLHHFHRLVLDLLDMSRMESGVDEAQLDWVDPVHLVQRVLRDRQPPVPLELRTTERPVRTDGRRLERVLTNLLDNAEAYAGGATRVALTVEPSWLQLTVDDGGPGVAPHERRAIFERLHRGEAARASGRHGNGLGLALVAEHVRLLGGCVEVLDAPGGGARFVVRLPLEPQGGPC